MTDLHKRRFPYNKRTSPSAKAQKYTPSPTRWYKAAFVPWYNNAAANEANGTKASRNSSERCMGVRASNGAGHSSKKRNIPMTMFIICNIGTGWTMESSPCVRKSQKTLGQKKPSIAAATWSASKIVSPRSQSNKDGGRLTYRLRRRE